LQKYKAMYSEMIVQSEYDNYRVSFTFESGKPPFDSLGHFSGNDFGTWDRDNNQSATHNCAAECGAGFWYRTCDDMFSNINQPPFSMCGGFSWDKITPDIELKETKLYLLC